MIEDYQNAIDRYVERFFEEERLKLISVIHEMLEVKQPGLAEDIIQDALIKAITHWQSKGFPQNPDAWVTRVAKNLACDLFRKKKVRDVNQAKLKTHLYEPQSQSEEPAAQRIRLDDEFRSEKMRVIYYVQNLSIPLKQQFAIILRFLCEFSAQDVANSLLMNLDAVEKTITRAKKQMQEMDHELDISSKDIREPDSLLPVLYAMFNEGYKSTTGADCLSVELCYEAMELLDEFMQMNQKQSKPKWHALYALMCFQLARIPARTTQTGSIVRLEKQDRSLWDSQWINLGMQHLKQSCQGEQCTRYHLEAAIASCHCMAPDYDQTDWSTIVQLYDSLMEMCPSPVIELSRATAVAMRDGPEAGLEAIGKIKDEKSIRKYYPYYGVQAELYRLLGDEKTSNAMYKLALKNCHLEPERKEIAAELERTSLAC